MRRLLLPVLVALSLTGAASGVVNFAYERGRREGREAGQCDIVVALDRAMRKKDPTWGAPRPIVKKCADLLAKHREPSDV